ncbi:predicted protein [Nematostella vectensis]|uniref:Uncharacterized protein n=1 Tax=Nematostella vectensis TaxID=45351 RepID=A7SUI3_NEMVE|nr:uncharacterized protein LOC5503793 [Nematostella vectensis]EDO32655.1 predicted protein [Nematostella vectensis]|eukprot:XP_001624755.1 predicted protein [Nematostella vectensis]
MQIPALFWSVLLFLILSISQCAVPKARVTDPKRQSKASPAQDKVTHKINPGHLHPNQHLNKDTKQPGKTEQIKRSNPGKVRQSIPGRKTLAVDAKNVREVLKPKATKSVKRDQTSKSKKTTATKKRPVKAIKEFPLNEIMFKGKSTNEANQFIKANDKVGKAMELVYEHAREQDLNDIEQRLQRRNQEIASR